MPLNPPMTFADQACPRCHGGSNTQIHFFLKLDLRSQMHASRLRALCWLDTRILLWVEALRAGVNCPNEMLGYNVLLCALQVGFSWAVAGSRVVDNKHHPSDVVGGFFLGASVALIFVIRATACLK